MLNEQDEFQSTHAQSVRQRILAFATDGEIVSIHARAERATFQRTENRCASQGFNPRTRRACDQTSKSARLGHQGFNPRTRRACDVFVLNSLLHIS